jgi:flavin reductase (DIM6/NTAB) family NADH-FMN oxidoreductase RutF
VNAFMSVSLDPPLVLVSLDHKSSMHRILPNVERFGINILSEHQESLSNHFAGRVVEGLQVHFVRHSGVPLIVDAAAHFVVRKVEEHRAGDHTLYIGEVEHFEFNDEKPLLFYAGRYRHLKDQKSGPHWPEDDLSLFSIGGFDPPVK